MAAQTPAFALRDSEARAELEVLRQRLYQVESSLQVRQMGLGEQLQLIREDMARLESKIDENEHVDKLLKERLDVMSIETRDSFTQLNENLEKRLETVDRNASRIAKAIEDFQNNLKALSDSLQTMSDFEKQQESRIEGMRNQLQQNLDVIVEEVGGENQGLKKDIAGISGEMRKLKESIGGLDTRMRQLSEEIKKVAALRRAPAAASPPPADGRHVVRSGESLSSIARRYGVTVEEMMAVNRLANPNLLEIGQVLVIPER